MLARLFPCIRTAIAHLAVVCIIMVVGVRITFDGSALAEDVDGGGVCWPAPSLKRRW